MKKQTIVTFFLMMLVGVFSISASAQSTHSIWTNENGLAVGDPDAGCWYSVFKNFQMATSWTEPAPPTYPAVAHFRGITKAYATTFGCLDRKYEFRLVRTSSTTADDIKGLWNVYRDGVLMCNACSGTAYNLSAPVGNYYKVYVDDPLYPGTENWLYSGYIDVRKDF